MTDTDPAAVRADAGGWISGPCLPADPAVYDIAGPVVNLGDLPAGTVIDLGTGTTRRIDLGQPLPIRLADQSPGQIADLASILAAALEDDADDFDTNMPAGSLAECSECHAPLVLGGDGTWRGEDDGADLCPADGQIRAHIPQDRPATPGWQIEAYRGYLLATPPGGTRTLILSPRPDAHLVARDRIEWAREFVDTWTDPLPPADDLDELGQADDDEPVVNEVHADRILVSTDARTGRVILHCQDDGSTAALRPSGGVPFDGRGGGDGTRTTLADLTAWATRHANDHLTVADYTRPGLPLPPPMRTDEQSGLWERGTDPDDLAYTSLHSTGTPGVVTIGAHCAPCGHPYHQTGQRSAAQAAIRRDHATHRAVAHEGG